MKLTTLLLCIALTGISYFVSAQNWPEEFILTPEKSKFDKTSTYSEVIQFISDVTRGVDQAHVIVAIRPEEKRVTIGGDFGNVSQDHVGRVLGGQLFTSVMVARCPR